MQDILTALQRASAFLLKPGNLVYWLGIALLNYAIVFLPDFLPSFLLMIFPLLCGALLACKMLDSATRIMQGLEDEAVPFAPLTVLPQPVALIVIGGVLLCSFIVRMIAGILGLNATFGQFAVTLLLAFLQPLWLIAVLDSNRFASLFAPAEWMDALRRIGEQRYFLTVGLPLAAGFVLLLACSFLPNIFHLPALAAGVIAAFAGALSAVAWAYFLADEADEELDFSEMDDMDFSDIVMDDSLLAAMSQGRADDIPEGDIVLVREEKAKKPAGSGLPGRLGNRGKAAQDETDVADVADIDAFAAAPPKAVAREKRVLPPDMSLLAEADVQELDLEEQILFVRDLMDADRLWQEGDLQAAENILQTRTDTSTRVAAYFPAFKRLDRIYRQQGREDARHALHERLLGAAAEEACQPAYHLVHEQLPQHDAAALPADWIYPLAQHAAAEGHYENVLHLTRNFARNHPEHTQIADNYFLAARALEKLGNSDTAVQLLAQLLQRYPAHEKIGQIRATHDLLLRKAEEQG